MTLRRSFLAAAFALATSLLLSTSVGAGAVQTAQGLPSEISDADFWGMIVEMSEKGGEYPYENFVSNEVTVQHVIPALKVMTKPGGVYIGVGPEQNFTYAAALESKLAFVVDIRRQNMLVLLMYKALFEASDDRADFVGRLFSRQRPEGLDTKTSPAALFAVYEKAKPDAEMYTRNLAVIKGSLNFKHGFALSTDDLSKIEYVFQAFYRAGPRIDYSFQSEMPSSLKNPPSYITMMNNTDLAGHNWSYLATEENYRYIKEMQRKNLIVPLVGDFAGPSVIRNIGKYLKNHNTTVGAFYVSNVEYYLNAPQCQTFYASVATLPVDSSSVLIRFILGGQARTIPWWKQGMDNVSTVSPLSDLTSAVLSGTRVIFSEDIRRMKDPAVLAGSSRPNDPGQGSLMLVPKGGAAPAGYTLAGTTQQTVQLPDGRSVTADFDIYTRK